MRTAVDSRRLMAPSGTWDRVITRRTLLRTGGSLAAAVVLGGPSVARAVAQTSGDGYPFALGVASGDPGPHSIVLWTRLAPEPLVPGGGMPVEPHLVRYEVARDEQFRRLVRRGAVVAAPEEAHSARVELSGLEPRREYFYRFKYGTETSPVGRTQTAPPAGARTPLLRFAFISCQNWSEGYFNAYADVVAQGVDGVVHLGDYIYEYQGSPALRAHAPFRQTRTLDDYRVRHGQYRTDHDLQAAHAACPWLVTWDDHEVADNYAGPDADPDAPPEEFAQRRAAAYRAYWEHMPLRRARKPVGASLNLYRRLRWGALATFNVLDTRQYRSDQPAPCTRGERDPSEYCPEALDARRTMLGAAQRDWLLQELATTVTQWNILAQSTAFSPLDRGTAARLTDNWDGYVAERQAVLDAIVAHRTPNPIVLTGDSHQNWVRNVPPNHTDLDAPPVATEFMGTSLASGGDALTRVLRFRDDRNNPHVLFRNNNRGYALCTLTANAWTTDYRIVPTVLQPVRQAGTLATFAVESGKPGAEHAGA